MIIFSMKNLLKLIKYFLFFLNINNTTEFFARTDRKDKQMQSLFYPMHKAKSESREPLHK